MPLEFSPQSYLKRIFPLLPIFFIFLLLRIIFMLTFPPFNDESIYMRWGKTMILDPHQRWASIQYVGKQPVVFWLFGLSALLFHHPMAARIPVLLDSIVCFFALYFWIKELIGKRPALWAVTVLTFSPMFILFQSMALMDGFLLTVTIEVLWFLTRYRKHPRWYYIPLMAILVSWGLWIKTTMVFLGIVLAGTILFIHVKQHKIGKGILWGIIFLGIPALLFLPFVLRPDFHSFVRESSVFVFSREELLHIPWQTWLRNIFYIVSSSLIYFSPIFLLALILGFTKGNKKKLLPFFFLFLFLLIPQILVGRLYTARYFLFALAPLFPFVAMGMKLLFQKSIFTRTIVRLFLGFFVFLYSGLFIFSPPTFFSLFPKNSILASERNYAFSATSGYGLSDIIHIIESARAPGIQIALAVVDVPGNPSDYLLARYYLDPQVHVFFATTNSQETFAPTEAIARKIPVTLIARDQYIHEGVKPYVHEIKRFIPPGGTDFIGIYNIQFPKQN